MKLETRYQDMEDKEGREVVISEKVFFGFIAAVIIALVGALLNPMLGAYGVIIGAFFTWVMASYLYAIYGVGMLDEIKLKVLLFLPTSIYMALVLYLFVKSSIVDALAQILGSFSSSMILYLLLYVIIEYYKAKGAI